MVYWFCVTSEENWKVIRDKLVWGVNERWRNTIQKAKPGDKLVIYITETKRDDEVIPSRIVGIFEIISEPYKGSSRIFKSRVKETVYPYRVKLKPIKIFREPIEFKQLISKLRFIKNKERWTGYVRTPMRMISEEDFQIMVGQRYE